MHRIETISSYDDERFFFVGASFYFLFFQFQSNVHCTRISLYLPFFVYCADLCSINGIFRVNTRIQNHLFAENFDAYQFLHTDSYTHIHRKHTKTLILMIYFRSGCTHKICVLQNYYLQKERQNERKQRIGRGT